MADENKAPDMAGIAKIYGDTRYFIDAIVSEYDFYRGFIGAVRGGKAQLAVNRRTLKKTVETQWMDAIEESLPALDAAIRHPAKYIEERDEVLPIEMSHNINSRSLRHLAQHTDFIKEVDGDKITPSKILNVFHEETLITYENKFLNTLIQRLMMFVGKRYQALCRENGEQNQVAMEFSSDFEFGKSKGKIRFSMEVTDDGANADGSETPVERLSRLFNIIMRYSESDFVKALGHNVVRPPIMRTNAILKNKDLRQCLILWQFIESYDNVGYTIDKAETAEQPDDQYIDGLYSLLSLQYMMFTYNLEHDFDNANVVLDEAKAPTAKPRFRTRLDESAGENEDYNVYDSEYRRVVPVSQLGSLHRLTDREQQIRQAIDTALTVDRTLTERARAEQRARRIAWTEEERRKREQLRASRLRGRIPGREEKPDSAAQTASGFTDTNAGTSNE